MEKVRKRFNDISESIDISHDNQRIEFGSPRRTIVDVAKELRCDLIIVGSHDRHGLQRLLGSTANAVVHAAQSDVYIIRYQEDRGN